MLKYFKNHNGLASFFIIFEGSNLEQPNEFGAAHLLEHLVCRKIKQLEDQFDLNGIEHNAGTCPTYTQYYIRGLDSKVSKFAQRFYDSIVKEPLNITERHFEEEKRIIIQEWMDDVNDSEHNIMNRFYVKYYKSPRTLGTLDALENLTFKDFKKMYERDYRKPLFCLIEQSSSWRIKDSFGYKDFYDSLFETNSSAKVKQFPKANNDNPQLLIVSDSFQSEITEHYTINLMLADGLNSPLYKNLRQKHQLVYEISSYLEFVNPYMAHSKFLTTTQRKNKDLIWKLFKETLTETDWLREKRFTQCVNKVNIEFEIARKLNHHSEIQSFLNPYESYLEDEFKKVKFTDVKKLFKKFYKPQNFIFFE